MLDFTETWSGESLQCRGFIMRMLVFSDTHGRWDTMYDIICAQAHDMVLHLGDCTADILEIGNRLPQEKLRYVPGNDLRDIMLRLPARQLFVQQGAVIFMTHGQDYSVRAGLSRLYEAAKSCGAALALYGHTHVAHMEKRGEMVLLNPGSLTLDRSGMGGSYAVVDIEEGEVKCRIEYI